MHKISENQTIVGVIDCTGHGVPGAFMSLVGFNLLNAIVIESKIFDPAQILEELSKRIVIALKQDVNSNHDGMDVVLCKIDDSDANTPSVVFAAAKRPLFVYDSTNRVVNKINGSKRLIGGIGRHKDSFENHIINLHKNDVLYLTTDGYSDQNDPKRARMTVEKMSEIMLENAEKGMSIQKEVFYTFFKEYKDTSEQRDDVTIVGIKL